MDAHGPAVSTSEVAFLGRSDGDGITSLEQKLRLGVLGSRLEGTRNTFPGVVVPAIRSVGFNDKVNVQEGLTDLHLLDREFCGRDTVEDVPAVDVVLNFLATVDVGGSHVHD